MKPRAFDRDLGVPEMLWFDDPEKLHHFTGCSVPRLRQWSTLFGLTIHAMLVKGREFEYIVYSEFRAVVQANTKGRTWKGTTTAVI